MTTAARLAELMSRGTDRTTAVTIAEELLRSPAADDPQVRHDCVVALIHAGEPARAQQHLDRAPTDVRLVLGAWLAASPAQTVDSMTEVMRTGTAPWLRPAAAALLVCALIDAGRLDEALDAVLAHRCDETAAGLFARGRLNKAQGHHDRAYADFLAAGRSAADITNPAVLPWCSAAALAAHATGRYVVARSLAQRDLVAARRWGDPRTVGRALHAVALTGQRADAIERLAEAVRLLEQAGAVPDLIAARHHHAQALAINDRHDEAADVCAATLAIDHPVWTDRTTELATRLARLRRLTPQEFRIANLASFRRNKEIAAELGLVIRTVELHLSNVYRKLGVTGRRELGQIILAFPD